MTRINASNSGSPEGAKLPRRDWVLLPSLSLLTVCVLLGTLEFVARRKFPNMKNVKWPTPTDCLITNDPATGVRGIPNSACWAGVFESGAVEYRFNSCGHRAGMECGPKPPGTYRIVMLGTSTALGWSVPREKSFAALLPNELTQTSGHKVELYNEAMWWESPLAIIMRFNDVLAAKPDMILWVVSPTEPMSASKIFPERDHSAETGAGMALKDSPPQASFRASLEAAASLIPHSIHRLGSLLEGSRSKLMLQHFLYESGKQDVQSYLRGSEARFMRTTSSAEQVSAMARFDKYVGEIASRSKAAGVPLVVVMAPYRAQAAMISMGEWPTGYDPYKLNNEIRSIVTSRGAMYIDILPDFRTIPNPEQGYFPVDRHPNADGHAMIS